MASMAHNSLLKILDGTVATVPPRGGYKNPMQTGLSLFICGGAFVGLEGIIAKRLGRGGFRHVFRFHGADLMFTDVALRDLLALPSAVIQDKRTLDVTRAACTRRRRL